MTSAPPHPGAAWQQCQDQSTGYPYYWNTVTNEVRWECPLEYRQWSRPASLPPPGLVTSISLATPSATPSPAPAPAPAKTAPLAKSSLVSGYDSEDDTDNTDNCDEAKTAPGESENQPDFIGPVIPKPSVSEPESVKSRSNSKDNGDDILSLIEAENPPDYAESQQPKLPSLSTSSREPSQPRQQTQSSILQLASNYDDSDQEEEEEKPQKNVTKLDTFGRLVFQQGDEGQTDEQRAALAKYKIENLKTEKLFLKNEANKEVSRPRFDNSIPGSRKRRLDLPRGKFNKTSNFDQSEGDETEKPASINFVPFVKSSTVLPGSIESHPTDENIQPELQTNNQTEENSLDSDKNGVEEPSSEDDVSGQTAELVEKMEHFKVGQEKISTLKTMAIKLEALYTAWTNGALTLQYLQIFLQSSRKKIDEAEQTLASPPWRAVWDRNLKSYKFVNQEDGRESSSPPAPTSATPPPPLPADDAVSSSAPPPPPPDDEDAGPGPGSPPQPPAPSSGGADHQLQDMDIDTDDLGPGGGGAENITDQLSMFYSEIEGTPEPDTLEPEEEEAGEEDSLPDDASSTSQCSAPNSPPPASPSVSQPKKRKKVKVSNNLALKKKGVGDMLAKWQKINN